MGAGGTVLPCREKNKADLDLPPLPVPAVKPGRREVPAHLPGVFAATLKAMAACVWGCKALPPH